jgi:Bacterial regulatory proteins, gntR family
MRSNLAVVCVAYVPEWEPLAKALTRVMTSGVNEQQAKIDICNAVADHKIAVRVVIEKSHQFDGGKTYSAGNVGVPPRLDPVDFDWTHSRPLKPWSIGPVPPQHYTWISPWQDRPISLIELSTADVNSVFCGDTKPNPSDEHLVNPRSAGRKPRKLERVKEAMKRDIRDGKHTATTLRNMREKNLAEEYDVSRDTVRKARDQVLSKFILDNSDKRQVATRKK